MLDRKRSNCLKTNPSNITGLVICYVCGHALQLFVDQRGVLLPIRARTAVCALHSTFSNTAVTSAIGSSIGEGWGLDVVVSRHIAQHLLHGCTFWEPTLLPGTRYFLPHCIATTRATWGHEWLYYLTSSVRIPPHGSHFHPTGNALTLGREAEEESSQTYFCT